jgi:hypothetical protein
MIMQWKWAKKKDIKEIKIMIGIVQYLLEVLGSKIKNIF